MEKPLSGVQERVLDSTLNGSWRDKIARGIEVLRRRSDLASTLIVSFATVGLQLAQGILLARLLGPEGRGEYATAIFWSQFLMYVGLFGCLELVCRYAIQSQLDPMKLRRSALRLGLVTGSVTTSCAVLGSIFLIPEGKQYIAPIACLCSLSALAQNVILIMAGVDRGQGMFRQYNLRRIVAAAALPTLILLALPFASINVTLVCSLYVIGSYLTMFYCLSDIQNAWTGDVAVPTGMLLSEARPYAMSMFAADLFDRLDLCLVLWMAPLVLQGYYATMIPVVYPLIIIPNTLGLFLFNLGAKSASTISGSVFLRTLLLMILIQFAMVIAFWIVAKPLIVFVYGSAFSAAIPLAMWLAPASACKGLTQGLEGFLKGRGRPQAAILSRVVAAILMVAITLALFPRFNVLAVAIAALISQLLCFAWIVWLVFDEIRTRPISGVGLEGVSKSGQEL